MRGFHSKFTLLTDKAVFRTNFMKMIHSILLLVVGLMVPLPALIQCSESDVGVVTPGPSYAYPTSRKVIILEHAEVTQPSLLQSFTFVPMTTDDFRLQIWRPEQAGSKTHSLVYQKAVSGEDSTKGQEQTVDVSSDGVILEMGDKLGFMPRPGATNPVGISIGDVSAIRFYTVGKSDVTAGEEINAGSVKTIGATFQLKMTISN